MKFFESCRNLGFEDKPDYSGYRRMFSGLMTEEGHTYDFSYDWLLKKSEREALKNSLSTEEEKEEPKKMTKAEKFRATQEKFGKPRDLAPEIGEEEKKEVALETKETDSKPKTRSKMPTSKRKTFTTEDEKEQKKKPDIYAAMKDAGFGLNKPKIVTNNVRSYRY